MRVTKNYDKRTLRAMYAADFVRDISRAKSEQDDTWTRVAPPLSPRAQDYTVWLRTRPLFESEMTQGQFDCLDCRGNDGARLFQCAGRHARTHRTRFLRFDRARGNRHLLDIYLWCVCDVRAAVVTCNMATSLCCRPAETRPQTCLYVMRPRPGASPQL
jgi:hypothetical protein